jgi:all-trans-retinol 13,14-reductase
MSYDTIVIGAGCGGLSCAAALALQGQKVLILEQGDAPGGFTRTVAHENWRWIDGMQYAGSFFPDEGDFKLMGLLTGGKLQFRRIDTEFQHIKSPYGEFTLLADLAQFKQQLLDEFPQEEKGLDGYFHQIELITKHFPATIMPRHYHRFFAEIATVLASLPLLLIATKTLEDELEKYFTDEKLKFILSSFWSSVGLPPKTSPFLVAGGTQSLFFKGVYVPVFPDMASGFVETVRKAGGELLLGSQGAVEALLFNDGHVVGARTADGNEHAAKAVVSNMGILRTAQKFVPRELWGHNLKTIEKKMKPSDSAFLLRIGFNEKIRELTDGNSTYRVFSDDPLSLGGDPTEEGWVPENGVMAFVMPPKDSGILPGAEIMGMVDFSYYESWGEMDPAERRALEEKMTKAILEQITLQWFPKEILDCIDYTELDSPFTLAQRNAYEDGAVYGLACTIEKMTDMAILPESQVKGLYFSGADVITQGTTTVMLAGILAASTVLEKNLLKEYLAQVGVEM